jgi:hypothetical protein
MLTLTAAGSRATVLTAAVSPTAINMRRVATMMAVVDRAQDGPLELEHVRTGCDAEAQRVSGTTAFVIACATGAAALSVIYGATQPLAILLVALAAAVGGLLRRWSGGAGAGPLVQALCCGGGRRGRRRGGHPSASRCIRRGGRHLPGDGAGARPAHPQRRTRFARPARGRSDWRGSPTGCSWLTAIAGP